MRILLVDKSEVSRRQLRVALEARGHIVVEAASGAEALSQLHLNGAPDLVVGDLRTPDLTGATLCRHVSNDTRLQQIPFVFYADQAESPSPECTTFASRYIPRPGDPRQFAAAIEGAVKELEEQHDLPTKAPPLARLQERRKGAQSVETRFLALVATLSEWFWELDQECVYRYSTPQVEQLLGYRPDEVIGRHPYDLLPEQAGRERLQEFLAGRQPYRHLELSYQHKNGRAVTLESSGLPLFDSDGNFRGYRGIDQDVTDRRQAEEALRLAALVLEHTPEVAYRRSPQFPWPLEYISRNVEKLGYRPEEFTIGGKRLEELIHPQDRDRVTTQTQRQIREGATEVRRHYRLLARDGRVRWVDDCSVLEKDSQGQPEALQGMLVDITEAKQHEERLYKVNRALRTLSQCNQALVRARDEPALLRNAAHILVQTGGFAFVRIAYPTAEGQRLATAEKEGRAPRFLERWEALVEAMPDTDPFLIAYRTNAPYQTAGEPPGPWSELALRHGFRAFLILPLHAAEQVIGAIGIFSEDPESFGTADLRLLMDLTDNLAYGIVAMRSMQEKVETEKARLADAERLQRHLMEAVGAIANAVEKRDPYTAGHQTRVARLAAAIGRELGWPEERVIGLRLAALVHDVGKIAVPSEMLSKPAHLTDVEYRLVREHPEAGYDIIKGIHFPWPLAEAVLQHHERLDGSGYPQGLVNGSICEEARVLAVADVVEAIASYRPYRPGLGLNDALEEIEKNRGKLYDADVVDACLRLFREKGFDFAKEAQE